MCLFKSRFVKMSVIQNICVIKKNYLNLIKNLSKINKTGKHLNRFKCKYDRIYCKMCK